MFLNFFNELRAAKVPVTLKEYLMLMEAMDKKVTDMDVEDFYYLSRAALVKDERNIDKFDKVFSHVFKGLDSLADAVDVQDLPEEWLRKMTEKFLTKEEMDEIEAMGGFEKLMETLKQRLEEQKKRHEGGNKWIGTGGTSPFGANGYNPEGRRARRTGKIPPPPCRKGVGQARVQELRRQRRAWHTQHQGRHEAPAQMGPQGRAGRVGP